MWAKYWLPAVPHSLLCATKTSLVPNHQLAEKLPAYVQHCSHCLRSFGPQVS